MEQLRCILCVLIYWTGYSLSDQYEHCNLGQSYNWSQAMEACKKQGGRLPEVKVKGSGLTGFQYVNNTYLDNEMNQCFWLGATYERVDNLTDDTYPNSCCENLYQSEKETYISGCVPCHGNYRYLCASGNNTIWSVSSDKTLFAPWLTAMQFCRNHSLTLASDTKDLRTNLPLQTYMWINGARRLNTNPAQGDGIFSICFCRGLFDTKCPGNTATFCLLEIGNKRCSGLPIDTLNLSSTFSKPMDITPSTVTNAKDSSQNSMTKESVQDSGALIGGVVGAVVVITIIIIIVLVYVFRRSKTTESKNSNLQKHVNLNNASKGTILANATSNDVDEESPDRHTLTQIQNLEKEWETYAVPKKDKISSGFRQEMACVFTPNNEQSRTGVYSVVNKEARTGTRINDPKQVTAGNEEYDKVGFGNSSLLEDSGNLYDTANFHSETFDNVYNKANFKSGHRDNDAGNLYDKANFDIVTQDEHSGNVYSKANFIP